MDLIFKITKAFVERIWRYLFNLPTVEEVYAQFMASGMYPTAVLVSGVPSRSSDDPKISDVDCIVWGDSRPELENERDYHTVTITTYKRIVNIRITNNPLNYMDALTRRMNELALVYERPDLIQVIQHLKRGGMNTTNAWAKILGLKDDVYEQMNRPVNELLEIVRTV